MVAYYFQFNKSAILIQKGYQKQSLTVKNNPYFILYCVPDTLLLAEQIRQWLGNWNSNSTLLGIAFNILLLCAVLEKQTSNCLTL